MKIKQTAQGYETTAKLPVVQVIPTAIPDGDGTGEADVVFHAPSKTVYTFDRVSGTWAAGGGGGGGTVSVTGSMTGDGSAGTPLDVRAATASVPGTMSAADKTKVDGLVAIASSGSGADLGAASVALTKLATQADQTFLVNVSGGPASPVAGTAIQANTALAKVLSERITVGSDSTDLVIAPTGWTLNGDTDGSYIFEGVIKFPAGSAATTYIFLVNADASNAEGNEIILGSSTGLSGFNIGTMQIAAGTTNAGTCAFRATFQAKSGDVRLFTCTTWRHDNTTTTNLALLQTGEYRATGTVMGPTSTIHANVANAILAGSWLRVTRTLVNF